LFLISADKVAMLLLHWSYRNMWPN